MQREIEGRPDDATLALKDLGEKTFYGGSLDRSLERSGRESLVTNPECEPELVTARVRPGAELSVSHRRFEVESQGGSLTLSSAPDPEGNLPAFQDKRGAVFNTALAERQPTQRERFDSGASRPVDFRARFDRGLFVFVLLGGFGQAQRRPNHDPNDDEAAESAADSHGHNNSSELRQLWV